MIVAFIDEQRSPDGSERPRCIAGHLAEIRPIPPSASNTMSGSARRSPSRSSRREGRVIRYWAHAAIRSSFPRMVGPEMLMLASVSMVLDMCASSGAECIAGSAGQPASRLSLRICVSKAREGTIRAGG